MRYKFIHVFIIYLCICILTHIHIHVHKIYVSPCRFDQHLLLMSSLTTKIHTIRLRRRVPHVSAREICGGLVCMWCEMTERPKPILHARVDVRACKNGRERQRDRETEKPYNYIIFDITHT